MNPPFPLPCATETAHARLARETWIIAEGYRVITRENFVRYLALNGPIQINDAPNKPLSFFRCPFAQLPQWLGPYHQTRASRPPVTLPHACLKVVHPASRRLHFHHYRRRHCQGQCFRTSCESYLCQCPTAAGPAQCRCCCKWPGTWGSFSETAAVLWPTSCTFD